MHSFKTAVLRIICVVAILVGTAGALCAAVPVPPDLTAGGVPDQSGEKHVLPGVRGWMFLVDGDSSYARQIQVTEVQKSSPWVGLLKPNDVIVGADGRRFDHDARKALDEATAKAEKAGPEGATHLLVWRADTTQEVVLKALRAPDLTQGGTRNEEHDWTLGPTGMRGWIYSRKGQTAEARQILVTEVDKGSPADGILSTSDVIVGVGGHLFDGDARIQFAKAITAAEQEQTGGVLSVMRWRAGPSTTNVLLKLRVLGSYSDTAPYDCAKSKKIFEAGCQLIASKGLKDVSIANDLNALALLASGKEEYRTLLADYAKKVAEYKTDSMATWFYGYANIFLAEYCMATGDASILPGVQRLALEAACGQSAVGTWGHKFARPDGNLNGYGCMNQPGLSLMISMVLARQAGVQDPVLDRAIAKGTGFLRWYVHKGAIPYGDHGPWPSHEDNGKCSSGAVLFDLLGDSEATAFFSQMATAAYDERERGHTGNFFNVLWAMLGVSRGGPLATGAYLKEQSWYYDLARNWQGGFGYQGSPAGTEEHHKYTSWDSTGAYLLAYALPRKSLYLTGKKPCAAPALDPRHVAEVVEAGRDFFPVNGRNGYDERTIERVLAGLSSWSPAERGRSAEALGRREGAFLPVLLTLLGSTNRDARYGAVEALGGLGARADAVAPQLRALLQESDPWLQCLACKALLNLGEEARRASVNDLLAMMARTNPADPRRMAQRAACATLLARLPGSRGTLPILAASLDGVDRGLLYPAIQSVLQNEDSVARGSAGPLYAKLSECDLAVLLPDIIKATEKLAPSDEMFADGVRLAGIDLLSRLHISEGLPLCLGVMDLDRWGGGGRVPKCLACLLRYGTHARAVLPRLQECRKHADSKTAEEIDQTIAAIQAATNTPPLINLKDFMAKAAAAPRQK